MELVQDQIRGVVGPEHFITDAEGLRAYTGLNIGFIPPRLPLMAVRPGTASEVRDVLKVANRHRLPVTPFSSSTHGHGASIPTLPGLTIDLRRLNGISLIDTQSRNAIIGPGVTFAQLQQEAGKHGLRVLTPVDLPADSSVVSTYLEMGPLFAWPRYGTESILTMEVLLPNGELQKTGSAALPVFNDKPYMPLMTPPVYLERVWFGSQGTLGIVTKAVVKLKTAHDSKKVLFATMPSMAASLEAIKEVKRLDYATEFFVADGTYLAGLLAEDRRQFDRLKTSLPAATLVMVLRGEPDEVAYQDADLHDLAARLSLELCTSLPQVGDAAQRILKEIDQPNGYLGFKELKGAYHVIPFMCMGMQVPMFTGVATQLAQAHGFDPSDLGVMLVPVEASRFSLHLSLFSAASQSQSTHQLFDGLSSTLLKMGAFFSRPYGEWAGQLFAKATSYKALIKVFKETIDPQGIMNPGKLDL